MEDSSVSPLQWKKRPDKQLHAHWDCFSGAAGDMMLAACLDSAGNGSNDDESADDLLRYITHCLRRGLFGEDENATDHEFEIKLKRVRKGSGSITGLHVSVLSRYGKAAAKVPTSCQSSATRADHHSHSHDHNTANNKAGGTHNHSHGHHNSHTHEHHNHSHGYANVAATEPSSLSSPHAHSHEHHHRHDDEGGSSASTSTSNAGPIRNLPAIRQMLQEAPAEYIPIWVRDHAISAFTELARAEAAVHGASSIDDVHFHEVGAVDSIVDTVGTLLALYHLNVTSCSVSRLPLGEGMVQTAHGILPVPAPATLHLMRNMAVTAGPPGRTGELVTPTAAALLKVLTQNIKPNDSQHPQLHDHVQAQVPRPPQFTLRRVGVGAGTKELVSHPNIVRLLLGDCVQEPNQMAHKET